MSELDKFASSALRGRKRGVYQQLLAGLLAKANRTNDPLIKILSICEATYMCKNKEEIDMEIVEVAYQVATSFSNTEIKVPISVAWTFPWCEENYVKYIKPWRNFSLHYYPYRTRIRAKKFPREPWEVFAEDWKGFKFSIDEAYQLIRHRKKIDEKVAEELAKLTEDEIFFQKSEVLPKRDFYRLSGAFTQWALRKLLRVQAILAREIDPQAWSEAMGYKPTAEVTTEKPDREEEPHGDQMGSGIRENIL